MMPFLPSPFWFISADTMSCAHCGGSGLVWPVYAVRPEACALCLGMGERPRMPFLATAARYSLFVVVVIVVLVTL